ncbi:MAG: outer membrane protein assembly factor BamA [Nitrospirae bacterium]|nr:outer membrane protein assembly factor BamA [Nitrospirota bacterium]
MGRRIYHREHRGYKEGNTFIKKGYLFLLRFLRGNAYSVILILLFLPSFTYASDVIRAIEAEGLSRIKQEELTDMICFHKGDVLDKEILRNGIKRAFKKNIFLDIKAVTEPEGDGIKLRYIVRELPVIKKIKIKGNNIIQGRKIGKVLFFKEGEDFREGFMNRAEEDLLHYYKRRGFPDARVKISVEKDETRNIAAINVLIEEGQPLIIKKISIAPAARELLRLSEGEIFDKDIVEGQIKKLRDYYKNKKYLKPVVGPYEFKNGELDIPVTPGVRLEVVFKGDSFFSNKELLREVPFFEDESVSGDTVEETADRIRGLYRGNGYYYAQVLGGIEREEDIVRVTFFIFKGAKVVLREIRLEGMTISHDAVKAVIPLAEKRPFDDTLLDAARESVIKFYHALGYLNADVIDVRKIFSEDGTGLDVVFVINEGSQVKIGNINIEGNKAVGTSEIMGALSIKKDDPYNEIDIGDSRYRILSLYNNAGYADAKVDIGSNIAADKASVNFIIAEHEPSVVGKIIIRGNEKTKDKIIRREFEIRGGEPYNYEGLLRTRQRLYKLGLFTDISIKPLENGNKRPGEQVRTQDLLVDLKEGNFGSVDIGVGYGDYERARGFIDINYRNLGGYNRQIGLRGDLSRIKERFVLNFREPWLFNKPSLPLNVSLIKERIRSINLDTKDVIYKIDRLSLIAGVEKEFSPRLKAGLNYEYSIVKTQDVAPGIILSREDTGTLGISSVSPSLFYDTRDNPFDPTSGSLKGIVFKFASKALVSDTEFVKITAQSSWYYQLKKGLVFAVALRGGAAYGLGKTRQLPVIERFFLGGRTTVRGFNQDTLGPKGEGDNPTGGNAFALANAEFRISLGKGLGLVTFVDAGNVWQKTNSMGTELRYTAGIGLRYNTPVGPIRIDYGQKLDRRGNESSGELHFSLGHAF